MVNRCGLSNRIFIKRAYPNVGFLLLTRNNTEPEVKKDKHIIFCRFLEKLYRRKVSKSNPQTFAWVFLLSFWRRIAVLWSRPHICCNKICSSVTLCAVYVLQSCKWKTWEKIDLIWIKYEGTHSEIGLICLKNNGTVLNMLKQQKS